MNIIVGGGKYGCYAAEFLRHKMENFVVVDVDRDCLAVKRFGIKASTHTDISEGEHLVQGDLATVLSLIEKLKPEYVFPTAPVHIAADLAKIKFSLQPWNEAVNAILPRLPEVVVLQAGKGKLVVSFNRDNDCVEKCPMPEVCPSSQIRKPCTMTKLMRFASPEAFILISYSMAPGMGALKGSELLEFFNWAKTRERFIVGTACDCHGVFTAFQKTQ
ncbi:hypothetical protein G4O51_06675 [Candidatus Bathyarchaeota archaeon A05DMB-2]|jgi:hypothetical protein|nr:hypothetical protein [Candidatus Bathyarchaeota archaeon A05DMB-2]